MTLAVTDDGIVSTGPLTINGGTIDVTAPLPPHMQQSWAVLGFDEKTGDGLGRFFFSAESDEGIIGTEIRQGQTLMVDTRPPAGSIRTDPDAHPTLVNRSTWPWSS